MGRLRAATLLLAALAAGLLLAACGSDSSNELLPGTTAKQIESNLDQVRSNAGEGNCEGAEEAVAEVSTEIDGLQKVDKELKKALKQGAAKLSELVSSCGVKEEEAEQAKAEEELEEEEQANLEAEEEQAEDEAEAEKEQKAEERDEKAQEKAEKHAEQPGPSEEGEESGPKGEAKGHEEEEIEPPTEEEVIPPTEGGAAGGIGPGAEVEGTP
jgi:hypothetical protein